MHKVIVYYDQGTHYARCEEFETTDDRGRVYVNRCLYCHDEEIVQTSCLGRTQDGRRCFRNTEGGGYCYDHSLSVRDRDTIMQFSWPNYSRKDDLSLLEKEALWYKQREILNYLSTIKDVSMLQIKDYLQNRSVRVYFIKCEDYVKIGKSTNPERRLKSLQTVGEKTLKPDGIDLSTAEILGHIPGGSSVETALHRHLKEHKVNGEWFSFNPEVASIIDIALGEKDSFTLESLIDKAIDNPTFIKNRYRWPEVTPEWISLTLGAIDSDFKDVDFYICPNDHKFKVNSKAEYLVIKSKNNSLKCPMPDCIEDTQLDIGFLEEYQKKSAMDAKKKVKVS